MPSVQLDSEGLRGVLPLDNALHISCLRQALPESSEKFQKANQRRPAGQVLNLFQALQPTHPLDGGGIGKAKQTGRTHGPAQPDSIGTQCHRLL